MTVYSLISYRPNGRYGYDRYDMEYSDSELVFEVFESRQELINKILNYRILSTKQDKEYKDWETRILVDGRDADSWTEAQEYEDHRFYEIEEEVNGLFTDWKLEENQRKENERIAKEKEKKAAIRKRAKQLIAQEKALLKTLLEKYSDD